MSNWKVVPIRRKLRNLWWFCLHAMVWASWKERNLRLFEDSFGNLSSAWNQFLFLVASWTRSSAVFFLFLLILSFVILDRFFSLRESPLNFFPSNKWIKKKSLISTYLQLSLLVSWTLFWRLHFQASPKTPEGQVLPVWTFCYYSRYCHSLSLDYLQFIVASLEQQTKGQAANTSVFTHRYNKLWLRARKSVLIESKSFELIEGEGFDGAFLSITEQGRYHMKGRNVLWRC